MKKVAFFTLGCKVNQYETEAISSLFEKVGYNVVTSNEIADVYVINTCTVTNLSDRKSRQMIRKAKKLNEDSIIVVTGCYAQTQPEEVMEIPFVNLVVGTKDRSKIVDLVESINSADERINIVRNIMDNNTFEELGVDVYKERVRAYVKIQEGCQQFCTYCIIPYARGPIRSREIKQIVDEVIRLADEGFKEVVLTGIHIASYGKDKGDIGLIEVINAVHNIEGIERIRLGSIEPTTLTDEFVEALSKLKKICHHFHVSLQSGCDTTLKRMNRKYLSDDYYKAIENLRKMMGDVSITTDVMVGFPGETDVNFLESYEFVKKVGFSKLHVFPYSPRKGTPAAKYKDQIHPSIKDDRSKKMISLSSEMSLKYNKKFVGQVLDVLFEQECMQKEGYIEGHTGNYIKVIAKGSSDLKGNLKRVEVFSAYEEYVEGKILS